ncbi:hypothetical protein Cpir12675_003617 [Ceratocystis pirilliformis]|uniref:MIF4G domain-containing protein n=1 Tax=Ceratocystis pirilliformis TaxID=259994 RepID=A0ABR3Z2R8_9PEZI
MKAQSATKMPPFAVKRNRKGISNKLQPALPAFPAKLPAKHVAVKPLTYADVANAASAKHLQPRKNKIRLNVHAKGFVPASSSFTLNMDVVVVSTQHGEEASRSSSPSQSPLVSSPKLTTENIQQYGYPSPGPSGQYPMPQHVGVGVPNYGNYTMPSYVPPTGGPGYNGPNYNAPTFTPGAQAAPMARSGSQQAEKVPVPSATPTFPPIVGSGGPATPGPKSAFIRPAKSAAIRITTPQGEAVDLSTVKAPASPAPAASNRAPSVVSSTPSRAGALTHPTKSREEVQEELRLKIAQFTSRGATEAPAKDDAKAKADKEAAEKAEKEAKEKADKEANEKAEKEAKEKAEKEAKEKAEKEAEEKAKAEEAKAKAEEAKAEEAKAEEAKAKADAPAAAASTEKDEMERMIREMEEADRLEAEREAEFHRKRALEKEAAANKGADKPKNAEEEDRKLREQEREMERLEEEKENERRHREQQSGPSKSVAELMAMARSGKEMPQPKPETKPEASLVDKIASMSLNSNVPKIEGLASAVRGDNKSRKPAALDLGPYSNKVVEPAQPSAALQSLKSARFLTVMNSELYPSGIMSPNPALNSAVSKKGKTFQYDSAFLLQFKSVFTEQPSTEFQSQVKTLIGEEHNRGGSARSSTPRTGSSKGTPNPIGAPIGGGFGTGRMSGPNGILPRAGTNPIGQFGRGAGFSSNRNMSGNNIPNSPRVGSSRGGRNNSNRPPKVDKQAAQMPLTAGIEIKPIYVSETGWKPTSISQKGANASAAGASASGNGTMEPAMVQRKVKAALNKMTPENFDRISEQILVIAAQSKDENDGRTLRQVIQLTFEKATDESHWASMYAKFCQRMLESTSNEIKDDGVKDKNGNVVCGGALFRKYLLNRCQEEFERGWKVNIPQVEDGKAGEAVLLSDEYYTAAAAKRRGLGLVQFIGEVYKLGMLTDRIMHVCIHNLVDFTGEPDEHVVESLCKLLTTIGGVLANSRNTNPPDRNLTLMGAYFDRIFNMIDYPGLNSRLRFMLMDVVDLRKSGWKSKEVNKGPKTLDEVRLEAEAAAAAKAAEAAKMTRGSGHGHGRMPMGHGDARSYSNGHGGHANSNQIGKDDLKRLRGAATTRSSGHSTTLGPPSMLTSSRSNSGRTRLAPITMMSRGNEDSASSSRTGTSAPISVNSFDILASLENHPGSPPSAAASPALAKATPDTGDKKE